MAIHLTEAHKRTLGICLLYAGTSITISMCYKALLSSWLFPCEFFMLGLQMAVGLGFCLFAKQFLTGVPGFEVPDFNWGTYQKSLPVAGLFVINIAVGWYGMRLVNVPLFLCIRRTTTVFTMAAEFLVLGRVQSPMVRLMVMVIILGTLVAGYETLSDDWLGYAYTLGNNVLTAAGLAISKRFSDSTDTKGFGMVYYNALTALPICAILSVATGELTELMNYAQLANPTFIASLLAASSLGVLMTYVVFLSATVNSPLVTSITGNTKDVVATVIGAALFQDFVPTVANMSGLLLSFSGALGFSYIKLRESGGLGPKKPPSPIVGATVPEAKELENALADPEAGLHGQDPREDEPFLERAPDSH